MEKKISKCFKENGRVGTKIARIFEKWFVDKN